MANKLDVGQLSFDFDVKTSSFKKQLKDAETAASSSGQKINSSLTGASKGADKLSTGSAKAATSIKSVATNSNIASSGLMSLERVATLTGNQNIALTKTAIELSQSLKSMAASSGIARGALGALSTTGGLLVATGIGAAVAALAAGIALWHSAMSKAREEAERHRKAIEAAKEARKAETKAIQEQSAARRGAALGVSELDKLRLEVSRAQQISRRTGEPLKPRIQQAADDLAFTGAVDRAGGEPSLPSQAELRGRNLNIRSGGNEVVKRAVDLSNTILQAQRQVRQNQREIQSTGAARSAGFAELVRQGRFRSGGIKQEELPGPLRELAEREQRARRRAPGLQEQVTNLQASAGQFVKEELSDAFLSPVVDLLKGAKGSLTRFRNLGIQAEIDKLKKPTEQFTATGITSLSNANARQLGITAGNAAQFGIAKPQAQPVDKQDARKQLEVLEEIRELLKQQGEGVPVLG